ncbi:MAG: CpaF family protein [Actinomycetota bacterium]
MRALAREIVLAHEDLALLDAAERRLRLKSLVGGDGTILNEIHDDIDGFGPLTVHMADDAVTDILVNGPDDVWIERDGVLRRACARFGSRTELEDFVERWIGDAGERIDAAHPIADARLLDGSRIHAVVAPVAPDGPLVSIRRFSRRPLDLGSLRARSMITEDQDRILREAVTAGRSIALSGATGTGKTTLLSALLAIVPEHERVVTIEETPELRADAHVVSLLARRPNLEGRGAVPMHVLVRAALRMRPDRIVIGEVRGAEAFDACMAFATGHRGSMVSIHAHSPQGALRRLTDLALTARSGASEDSLRAQIVDAFDLIVQLERVEGVRRVVAIDDAPASL